jgi:GTP-binding protein
MTTALSQRASLRGLLVVIDSRRGVLARDEELVAWAAAVRCPVHVLLSKSDKLKRAELARTLAAAQRSLEGRATAQAFSAKDGTGLEAARGQLNQWLKK